jgi:hypothetical protein
MVIGMVSFRSLEGSCKEHNPGFCVIADDSLVGMRKKTMMSFLKNHFFRVKPVSAEVSNLQLVLISLQSLKQLPQSSCYFRAMTQRLMSHSPTDD